MLSNVKLTICIWLQFLDWKIITSCLLYAGVEKLELGLISRWTKILAGNAEILNQNHGVPAAVRLYNMVVVVKVKVEYGHTVLVRLRR